MDAAAATCRSQSGLWTESDGGARCDVTPGTFVRISACSGAICEIQVLDFRPVEVTTVARRPAIRETYRPAANTRWAK